MQVTNKLSGIYWQRWFVFAALTAVLSAVSDGWAGKPSPLVHQLLLIPFTLLFGFLVWALLGRPDNSSSDERGAAKLVAWTPALLLVLELLSVLMMVAEAAHFRRFGYRLTRGPCVLALLLIVVAWCSYGVLRRDNVLFLAVMATYGAGAAVAIKCFPLNYLRSDMLPVISWADQRLVRHLDPYQTMHVGIRLYDFPYLPGMLVAYWPLQAAGLDLRIGTFLYLAVAALLIYRSARSERRVEVGLLLGVFLLCPFLQYRHDLYLEPHWLTLVLAVVLMHRRHFAWAAVIWGISCGVYQLSWVVAPFFVLNALRRGGMREALKLLFLLLVGALLVMGPFVRSASQQVAHNTVGQWSHLSHALADPINLSFWLTYVVRPDQLKWVQATVLVALFFYCFHSRRCANLVDTVRWMACALAVFIPLNVLVDGYFYLTLLLLLLLYTCLANGWWQEVPSDFPELPI